MPGLAALASALYWVGMEILSVSHLTKRFGEKIAVDDVTLAVQSGGVHALIGPNGSGKTTIVKVIAGLLNASAGTVRICGTDVSADPVVTKSAVGYIPDEPNIWGTMTGEEFLHFTGALFGMPLAERSARIAELLSYFRMSGMQNDTFSQYSRGSRQKFSIMAALLHHPKLLLIDEPIVGLDPHSANLAKSAFAKFAHDGGAVLLVTHTLSAAQELASTVSLLKNSKIIAEGPIEAMRQQAHLASDASLDDVYEALAETA